MIPVILSIFIIKIAEFAHVQTERRHARWGNEERLISDCAIPHKLGWAHAFCFLIVCHHYNICRHFYYMSFLSI